MRDERGFALVITLIVTALLVALTAEFVDEVYVDTSLGHNFVAAQQAGILAASGEEGAEALLSFANKDQTYVSLYKLLAQPLTFEEDEGKLVITIQDESGKLNLNRFPPTGDIQADPTTAEMAGRLFRILNFKDSEGLVQALADWRGNNEIPHPNGAKTQYYSTLTPPYAAKNGPLDTVEELALVKGFAGASIEKLKSLVTVYSDQQAININTAPEEIIEAIDPQIGPDKAKQVLAQRPFENTKQLGDALGDQNLATGLYGTKIVFTKGDVYRITSTATVGETTRTVEAVVRISNKKYLYWREF